ncbi:mannitol dehydrogenase family protein [Williamsia muralis]|uniref:Mannitol-1-phosphate 5-dehydrogenase n=1 Tax=Williamsia marianensis TaxID=85044 RepID=A0A2G3PPS1_WILMA|nr:mannitol dehydrogenase family protein [Williamsia marianensis]PHV67858.1 mannitol dehydrogenase [Williamsia marianensis]
MPKALRLLSDTHLELTDASLPEVCKRLSRPAYDRAGLSPSIVHIGVGGFHRAHQAVYLDELACRGISTDWGVVGAGLHGRKMKEALEQQACLYTVVERGADREQARVVGSMLDYLYAPDDSPKLRRRLADPNTRIVSLTITGNGYHLVRETGELDDSCPQIVGDLANPDHFATAVGYLVDALRCRRHAGTPPFTVLSCDNIPDNGVAAQRAVVRFAELRDPELARWIERNVSFPSTMVDRITPRTTPSDRVMVEKRFGIVDRWPVLTEPFSQWVIEDNFCNGRPPLEEVGVDFVTDVAPHKLAKTRLLNGAHCALGVIGGLLGHETTDQAMNDHLVSRYIEQLLCVEISPLVPPVNGLDLGQYCNTLLERFANPKIGDQLSRLRARGSTKFPSYLLPSLNEARQQGRPSTLLIVAVAAWMCVLRGTDSQGRTMDIEDARSDELRALAPRGSDPRPLLDLADVFGSLGEDAVLAAELEGCIRAIDREGLRRVLGQSARRFETGASA